MRLGSSIFIMGVTSTFYITLLTRREKLTSIEKIE
jgi:hypothetical protein